ncbi:MAG: uracil-DNA glycosylase [Pseudomonadota bacterium]|nr:uracil-DNA glycosylase [Pseudomonadota bacterium]
MGKDRFGLLYGQLWLVDALKLRQINSHAAGLKLNESKPDSALVKQVIANTNNINTKAVISLPLADVFEGVEQPRDNTIAKSASILDSNSVVSDIASESAVELILDWNTLVNQVSSCVSCKLCKGRTNVVIERGSRAASVMFVGEGPGEDEDIQGAPFVGKSGQLLDKMIAAMGLDKDNDVYICNVVKCRPPYNRNPEIDEIAACNHYLRSQIELVKPKIIITLGRFASQTLLNSNLATGKLRGQIHKFKNIPLVVTYHPAYLLRNPNAKKDAWADLKLVMSMTQH